MQTRTLTNTNLTVSRACLGTMNFGSDLDAPTAARLLNQCIDAGINFFDTSNVYNFGVAETILGNLLKPYRD